MLKIITISQQGTNQEKMALSACLLLVLYHIHTLLFSELQTWYQPKRAQGQSQTQAFPSAGQCISLLQLCGLQPVC